MKKIYGKNWLAKGGWLACTLLLFFLIGTLDSSAQYNTTRGFLVIIFLFCLVRTIQCWMKKLIISEDHVTIKEGVLFKSVKDIKYKKINSVDINYVLWFGGIEIQMGNDKPIIFKNLEKYEEVRDYIHQKIDQ